MPYKKLSSLPQCRIIPQAVAHCGAGVWERGFSSLLERSSAATNESKDESGEWLFGVLQEQSQWYHPLPATSNCAQVRVENTHWSNWSHLVKKNASHSHVPLNEPNYSRTNKESWHTVSQAFTCHVYICSESICTPDSTHIYFSSELPTLTPYPELAVTMPGSSSLPRTSVSRATKWNPALSCTNWGWKYFLMPKINLNTFQCSS